MVSAPSGRVGRASASMPTTYFNASLLCNNKLVGARAFDAATKAMVGCGVPSPRDRSGHGTHVASTAAGSEVCNTGMLEFARGTARGIAPKARIAMYKAYELRSASIVAAIDAAVKDGVDILSMSIGDPPPPLPFHTVRAGVLVVLSGGNEGPKESTVVNVAPWMTTVGAATVDRLFPANLILGDGTVVQGQSLYAVKANRTTMTPLVYSRCTSDKYLVPDKIKGKIVVCTVGTYRVQEVMNAGGSGLVYMDTTSQSRDGSRALPANISALTLSHTARERLMAYMASSPYPVA
ncbi:hypothetical protein PR202_gb21375 [Eleusine coracana subsp. coracana]|uniref:Peptidase S8/S53 domain-containing protein n=1 Tax=Eleusine coracana subsp. coracana TaxID=191504 RepID=A0AAV5FDA0_ELECO|nr:hypothetical protein PR202_gb21375 [Eleusine coracana subsp. coracana]